MTNRNNSSFSLAGLFVGCGGLDYGFHKAGFNLVWANEFSADAAKSYTDLIGHHVEVDDIWNVIDEIPNVDVLIGGPPCQSFSLVGKRLDADPRGKLVFAFQQVIERVEPKAFVMENVPGLMASMVDGKRLPLYLAEQFEKLGYKVSILKLVATDSITTLANGIADDVFARRRYSGAGDREHTEMRENRSASQILFGFLPEQTVDLKGGVWKVRDWKHPIVRNEIDIGSLKREIVRQANPWRFSGMDGGFVSHMEGNAHLTVLTLNEANGVEVVPFPKLWICKYCKRVHEAAEASCRQSKENWSPEMRSKANIAAAEFWTECKRLRSGISLLQSDQHLLSSFKGMNRALSKSADGKYDSWRPFQYGFLLANLASIVNRSEEALIVDVVWFSLCPKSVNECSWWVINSPGNPSSCLPPLSSLTCWANQL